jgi:hypothetical protein
MQIRHLLRHLELMMVLHLHLELELLAVLRHRLLTARGLHLVHLYLHRALDPQGHLYLFLFKHLHLYQCRQELQEPLPDRPLPALHQAPHSALVPRLLLQVV